MLETDITEDSTDVMCSRFDGRGVVPSTMFISSLKLFYLTFLSDSCFRVGIFLAVGRLQAVLYFVAFVVVFPLGDRIDFMHDYCVCYFATVSDFLGRSTSGTSSSLNLTVGMALKVKSPVSFWAAVGAFSFAC